MKAPLPTRLIARGTALLHVSRSAYAAMPYYFGSNGNRYDDPAGRYGVLYAAFDLSTALMESVFHDHDWSDHGTRLVHPDEVGDRIVRHIAVFEPLSLLDLTRTGVMASHFGLNLEQLSGRDYRHTRHIALLAHGQLHMDGIVYPSRNNYPSTCLALFDRCRDKLGQLSDVALERHPGWPSFVDQYELVYGMP